MMPNISSILISILVFSILVVVHEFGHFIVAKKSGVLVEEFAVGMGPLLFSKQKGETLYSIRLFPLGGFCRMLGEDEACSDERGFQSKSVWARIAVIAAGPFMNFLFAFFLILCLVSTTMVVKPEIRELTEESPAQAVGMQVGDRITKVNGKPIYIYDDLQIVMSTADGSPIEVETERDGRKQAYNITPKFSEKDGKYLIGFSPLLLNGIFAKEAPGYDKASLWDTAKYSFDTMVFYVRYTAIGLAKVFTFNATKEEVAGPIGIFKIVGESYEAGIRDSVITAIKNLAYLGAMLSANLGVLNLFPIPALDGGRLMFLFVEAIRRKPVNPEMEGRVHFAGFMVLIGFMVFIAYNDIVKIFMG